MKTPICEVCLNSDMLCGGCEQKLNNGLLSQADINVSRELYKLSDKNKSLEDIVLKKVIDADVMLIISGKGDAAKLIGKKGVVVKSLAQKFEKNIKILEESDFNNFSKEFFSPVPILGVNVVYSQGGEKHKIRLPAAHKEKLGMSLKEIPAVFKNIFNKEIEVSFE